MIRVTVMPPHGTGTIIAIQSKWQYHVDEDGQLAGTLFFPTLRDALLKVWRDGHAYRVTDMYDDVLWEGDKLDPETAKKILADEERILA